MASPRRPPELLYESVVQWNRLLSVTVSYMTYGMSSLGAVYGMKLSCVFRFGTGVAVVISAVHIQSSRHTTMNNQIANSRRRFTFSPIKESVLCH